MLRYLGGSRVAIIRACEPLVSSSIPWYPLATFLWYYCRVAKGYPKSLSYTVLKRDLQSYMHLWQLQLAFLARVIRKNVRNLRRHLKKKI